MKITAKRIDEKLRKWQRVKNAWDAPVIPDNEVTEENLTLFIYQSYLHLQSVTNVYKKINELGFTKKSPAGNQVKYKSNDISDTIRNCDIEDHDLQAICRWILTDNSEYIDYLYN